MTDLADLRDRVEDLLKDASNADWSTGELDNAIRLALSELSIALPARAVTTMDAVADTCEYSVSGVSGLVEVVEVWYPYLATDESYRKPHPVKWRMLDDATLLIESNVSMDAAYDIRIFYDQAQTLAGLDGAASTTLNSMEKSALIVGSAGFAATSLAIDKADKVTLGKSVPDELRNWGWAQVMEFRQRLADLAAIVDAGEDTRIGWWASDKWDAG